MLRHSAKCLLAEDRSHYRVESYWGCQLGSVQVSSAMQLGFVQVTSAMPASFCAGHFCLQPRSSKISLELDLWLLVLIGSRFCGLGVSENS